MFPRPADGSRLGPYELLARIGKGGMGEVWKARDTRLDREVAVKISAEQFSDRFEREARAIAALNHPNICTLFDVGPNYLVMELIDGPTLADRIAEGPIPLEEALGIAKQIADALEAAHEKNIVHRDLKPGNIKVRSDGSVKVLDFGLAKAGLPGAEVSHDSPTLVHSPTLVGVILGTAAYMAPEQARGKVVDKRADIWSFGVVLHEMLTGKRAFEGEDLTETLASVVKSDPDLTVIPHKVRRLLAKCLQKDPKKRLRDIGDAWELLDDSHASTTALLPSRLSMLWLGIAAVAFAAITGAAVWWLMRPAPQVPRAAGRFSIPLPEGQNFTRTGRHVLAISPDGKRFAYVANRQLYLRNMNELEARPVPGTNEDPMEPVFSPDGRWLAYFISADGPGAPVSGHALRKIAVAGGAATTLSMQVPGAPFGAVWSNGEIAFGINNGGVSAIMSAPEAGGPLRLIAKADATKELVMQPQLLPDGKHVMFEVRPINATTEGQIVVQDLDGNGRRVLVNGGSNPHVLSSGQLVYIRGGVLLAVPFDNRKLTVTGEPVMVLEGVSETGVSWAGQFAVSSEGTLVFRPGGAISRAAHLMVWVDREGHEQPIPARVRGYVDARISPDGRKIAVLSNDEEPGLWIFDLEKETLTRLTFGPGSESDELWSADGKSLFFTQAPDPEVSGDIHRKAADGTGTEEALTLNSQGGFPLSLTPDGKSLVYLNPASKLFVLPLDPKGAPYPLLRDAKGREGHANISPDGRWIAYASNESGRSEVYVRPFPAVDSGRWQISAEGGSTPVWSGSGREFFFLTADAHIAVVAVQPGASFAYGKPQSLFNASSYFLIFPPAFDVSPDGKRFLMIKAASQTGDTTARPSIVVAPNWIEEVKARMAGGR